MLLTTVLRWLVLSLILLSGPFQSWIAGQLLGEVLSHKQFAEKYGPFALVIGASRGLGLAWANGLAEKGLNVVLTGRVQSTLEESLKELQAKHPDRKFVAVQWDFSDTSVSEQIAKRLCSDYDIGMVVVNAVFSGPSSLLLNVSIADLRRAVNLNIVSTVDIVHVFGNAMRQRQRGGGFILVSSIVSQLGVYKMAMYSASKAFVSMLTEVLWYEGKQDNIDFIAPIVGQTSTPSLDDFLNQDTRIRLLETTPEAVVDETFRTLGRSPFVYTGWSTKLQAFFFWLVPHDVALPWVAYFSKDFFIPELEFGKKFDEVMRSGRSSRS